ncbi:MAG: hypothetical protein UE295_11785 [Acutalibacteraceae bacterium]|nr:hypothetical protein [Acutalibacteraceae bacterium]
MLTYSTYIHSWKATELKENPATPENSKYAGQQAVTHQAGELGPHRMTLVGYNDNLWIDVNGNNAVDEGEIGAFKVANSWGKEFGNDGLIWVAYDALNLKSAVNNGPTERTNIFSEVSRIEVKKYNSNADIYMVYTMNTRDRMNARAEVTAEKDGIQYTKDATPMLTSFGGTRLSYDGTSTPGDGTMVFPLSSVIPDLTSENFNDYKWSVKFINDNKMGDSLIVKMLKL